MSCDITSGGAEQSAPACSLTVGVGGLWALTSSHVADALFPRECCSEVENRVEFKALVDLDCFSAADFKIPLCCCPFFFFFYVLLKFLLQLT